MDQKSKNHKTKKQKDGNDQPEYRAVPTEDQKKEIQRLRQSKLDLKKAVAEAKSEQIALKRQNQKARKWVSARQVIEGGGTVEDAALVQPLRYDNMAYNPPPYNEVSGNTEYPEINEYDLLHSHWLRGSLHYMDGYFFSRLYPGQVAVPLVHSNEIVPAHNSTAVVTTSKPTSSAEWITIVCCSTWGSMNDGPGIYMAYPASLPTTSTALASSATLSTQPWTDWYGSTMDTFTSGCIIWATEIQVSLECALSTLSGSAYVGAISYGQWIAGVPSSALIARAEKIDLKQTGGKAKMRNLIQNTAIAYNPPSGGSISLGAARGEMVSYMLIHAPALSLTGPIASVTPVVTVASNYLWWSDLSNVLLDQIVIKKRTGTGDNTAASAFMFGDTIVTGDMLAAANGVSSVDSFKKMLTSNSVGAHKATTAYVGKPVNPNANRGRQLGMISNTAKKIGGNAWNSFVKNTPWLGNTLGKTYGDSSQMSNNGMVDRLRRLIWSLIEDISPADLAIGGLSLAGLMDDVPNGRTWTPAEAASYLSGIVKLTRIQWIGAPPEWLLAWRDMIEDANALLSAPEALPRLKACLTHASESSESALHGDH